MWQQLIDAARGLRRQPLEHVLQVDDRVMTVRVPHSDVTAENPIVQEIGG